MATRSGSLQLYVIGCGPVSLKPQNLMYVGFAAYATLLFVEIVRWGTYGNVTLAAAGAAMIALCASPLLAIILRMTLEKGTPKGQLDPRTQSWMFLFGDTIFLPFAFGAAMLGWHKLNMSDQWHTGWLWMSASAGIGIVAGVIFHHLDVAPYTKQGMGRALNSPTKIAHDFVAYPVLFAGLVYLGVPVIFGSTFAPYGILTLVGVVLWGAAGMHDQNLLARDLHPNWDAENFHIIT